MERTDIEEMLARVAMGDRAAFDGLYKATSAKLFGVALRVLNNQSAAEDALQDTFIKIWHSADRYAAGGHSPMSWLITIARNTAIDRLRRRRDTSDIESHGETLAASGPSPEAQAIHASETARIIACMDELPDDRRDAISQVYLRGASYADCAQRFDKPLNTIRTWLRRGLESLRECLAR